MNVVKILDEADGSLGFDLRHVLAALGPRAARSSWDASGVAAHGESLFATGDKAYELEAVAEPGGSEELSSVTWRRASAKSSGASSGATKTPPRLRRG